MEFEIFIFQAWKVVEFKGGPWKVMEFQKLILTKEYEPRPVFCQGNIILITS